jgi:ABC-type nitrate/sulfonate/bicarbonate transport system permease component
LTVTPTVRLRILAFLVILAAWEALGASGLFYAGALPSWGTILPTLLALLLSPSFWSALLVTGLEIGLALCIGGILGVLVGMTLGSSNRIGVGLQRYVHYVASTPKVIFLPVIFLLFGIGPGSKVAIGAFACSFPLALGTAAAMRHIPPVLVRVGRGFHLSRWQMARLVYLPAILVPIMSGLRIALGIAISACLVAEMRVSNRGLGSLIISSYEHARFADVYAVLLVVVGGAVLANALLDRLSRHLSRPGTP